MTLHEINYHYHSFHVSETFWKLSISWSSQIYNALASNACDFSIASRWLRYISDWYQYYTFSYTKEMIEIAVIKWRPAINTHTSNWNDYPSTPKLNKQFSLTLSKLCIDGKLTAQKIFNVYEVNASLHSKVACDENCNLFKFKYTLQFSCSILSLH